MDGTNAQKMTPLLEQIIDEIVQSPGRAIPFVRFMELALYHPEWGYYQREQKKVGKEGDFYTSPFVGDVFGRVLADVLLDMRRQFPRSEPWGIVEVGGGDGRLAEQILNGLAEQNVVEEFTYVLLDKSPYHQKLQSSRLQGNKKITRASELTELPNHRPWILLSNELIDAFPVHRVRMEEEGLRELYVTWDADAHCLRETTGKPSTPELEEILEQEGILLQQGQTAEVNVAARDWIQQVGSWLKAGFVLTIDYGFEAKELYSPERRDGTLMCYRRHQAHNNPYRAPGEEDITSHVNFSGLKLWGKEVGLTPLLFVTQGSFLMRAGIFNYLSSDQGTDPFGSVARRNRAIRQLIHPEGMGDRFQVLIQSKGLSNPQLQVMNDR